ncbi:hypothetical protein HME9302_02232 [Alteripontixanthobacter maritimus]|uniref:DUF2793 domain-containing protein n=1 Tax=Alteripontixanthobacter maritimus TaxID=2161824 RepID=A0A369QBR2_9SPHN|nr:DUF2793 domain-containing protein [Alteripontixanthobacter maritimus]RDC61015.1 hypothetical protein HME9302_02232 [Alteripontixanthobacter maritimus]
MTTPLSFISASPRYSLPFLFVGQAQKEFFVNEALARIDTLLHPAVSGEASAPPATPEPGETWLVGSAATSEWAGHDAELAAWQAGEWNFVAPSEGTRIYRIDERRFVQFANGWQSFDAPAAPSGGNTIDVEARAGLENIVNVLKSAGILG